jgi:hypothetical protein
MDTLPVNLLYLSKEFNVKSTTKDITVALVSPWLDQEGKKLQRQKIALFIYPISYHNRRNISIIYTYNMTSIKRNILPIKQNTSGSRSG